jgi:hypothetical protein
MGPSKTHFFSRSSPAAVYCQESETPQPPPASSSLQNAYNPQSASGSNPRQPVRRSRHISICSDAAAAADTAPTGDFGTSAPPRGYRVRSHIQKAVRRLSVGGSSGGGTTSPSPTTDSPTPPNSARANMEKPGWGVVHRANPIAVQYRRTRHHSLTVDSGGGVTGGSGVAAGGIGLHPGQAQRRGSLKPPLRKADSSPLPPDRRDRRSSNAIDEFPYSPAFAYAPMGKESTHFPCGSEAVMINAALAFEAFKGIEEVKLTKIVSEIYRPPEQTNCTYLYRSRTSEAKD